MRALFVTWAWPSHLYALVPLAWAIRAAGHEVLVASQPGLMDEITRTGLAGAAVGADVDAVGLVRGYVLPSADDAGQQAPRTGKGPRAMQMFLAHAESMTDDLVELTKSWGADVVVYEPTALAGPIAAAAAGVPAVRHLYGTDLMLRARPILGDLLAPLAARHGVSTVDPYGAFTVDPTPGSLQVPVDYRRLPMRHVAFCGAGPARVPPASGSGTGRVCVTWGHTMAKLDPAKFLAPQVIDALSAEPGIEIVAAVSSAQRELVGSPDGVEILVDASLDDVVGGCDLVVAHGGAGTVLTAIRHAVPMLLIPQLPDHTGHAARVLATGAGEVLTRDQATGERIRKEAARLLADETPRKAVQGLAEEMREAPTPALVARRLEEIVSR
ncbi:MAG TPA: nucleotide disphospho-sugar-binding domain-containing protein [Amycolatopsis sp.]|nr:nucleotide disphospho-sugar-binding domain-containing protein [Amycolatopsis sp.]